MEQFFKFERASDGSLWKSLALFGLEFLIILAILLVARRLALRWLERIAERTDTKADDFVIDSIRHPSIFWAIAIALYVIIAASGLPAEYVNYGLRALYVLITLSVTLAAANIISRLVQGALEKSAGGVAVTGLSRTVIKAVIFAIGGLIILNGLGVSITPMLTALGVGGLAVALALQDTLSNFFAGMHILMERPIKVGDYIKMSTGEEGFVIDIGWRTTRIRQLANNIIIIPNNKLAQSVLINHSLPEERMSLLVSINVSYSADPDHVEKVLVDEAGRAVGEIPGLLGDPSPFVRFIPGFGEYSMNFTLICQVASYVDQYLVQHELRKRIFNRFKAEGIEFPLLTTRTVHLKQM